MSLHSRFPSRTLSNVVQDRVAADQAECRAQLADIAAELERLRQINERVERNKIRLQRQQQDSLKVRCRVFASQSVCACSTSFVTHGQWFYI